MIDHIVEIACRRFIRAHVFGRVDGIETNAQLLVAECEGGVVDVRENDKFVVPLEIDESACRVGEDGPVANGLPVGLALFNASLDTPFFGETLVNDSKEVAVYLPRCIALLFGFMTRMRFQNRVAAESRIDPVCEGL